MATSPVVWPFDLTPLSFGPYSIPVCSWSNSFFQASSFQPILEKVQAETKRWTVMEPCWFDLWSSVITSSKPSLAPTLGSWRVWLGGTADWVFITAVLWVDSVKSHLRDIAYLDSQKTIPKRRSASQGWECLRQFPYDLSWVDVAGPSCCLIIFLQRATPLDLCHGWGNSLSSRSHFSVRTERHSDCLHFQLRMRAEREREGKQTGRTKQGWKTSWIEKQHKRTMK